MDTTHLHALAYKVGRVLGRSVRRSSIRCRSSVVTYRCRDGKPLAGQVWRDPTVWIILVLVEVAKYLAARGETHPALPTERSGYKTLVVHVIISGTDTSSYHKSTLVVFKSRRRPLQVIKVVTSSPHRSSSSTPWCITIPIISVSNAIATNHRKPILLRLHLRSRLRLKVLPSCLRSPVLPSRS